MVDDGRTDDGRTDGRTTEHGYTISSPCEPDGSGELKTWQVKNSNVYMDVLATTFPGQGRPPNRVTSNQIVVRN